MSFFKILKQDALHFEVLARSSRNGLQHAFSFKISMEEANVTHTHTHTHTNTHTHTQTHTHTGH